MSNFGTGGDPDMWDEAPKAIEVDLTTLDDGPRTELLKNHIDEELARTICHRIDGSGADYEANMRRINQILGYMKMGLGTALKIIAVA
tara:strand:+ start:784 stop:1047 length:264 start_codon:yes stop_codon:yes gene_type:complete